MTFADYWAEVEKLKDLPQIAIQQLPSSLSPESKRRLMKKQPKETAELLNTAIEEVNRGAVDSIDRLVWKKL